MHFILLMVVIGITCSLCGGSGDNGDELLGYYSSVAPSSGEIPTAYSTPEPTTVLEFLDATYSGTYLTFIVPVGINSLLIFAYGAQGGACTQHYYVGTWVGGLGGSIQAAVSVTPGQELFVYVGGMGLGAPSGTSVAGGYNGGGSGDTSKIMIRRVEEREGMYLHDTHN